MQVCGQSLLSIQANVIDQPYVAKIYSCRQNSFSILNFINRFQGFRVYRRNVVQARQRFGADGFYYNFSESRGISFTVLKRRFRFAKGLKNYRRLLRKSADNCQEISLKFILFSPFFIPSG